MSNFFQGFAHAARGLFVLVRTERNFKIHLLALAVVITAGLYFSISTTEWVLLILTSSLVMGLEAINTSVEKLSDELTSERKLAIRDIKDIAAGAVLISSIGALATAMLIFWKYF